MKRLARWFLVLTTILLIGWIGWTSPTLNECLSHQYENYSSNTFQEEIASFYVLLVGSRLCIGEFIHTNGEGIIAIFTVILGIATWSLWKATRDLVNDAKATGTSQISAAQTAADAAIESNKLSREMFVASERPWVVVDYVQIKSGRIFDEIGAHLDFDLTLKNAGNSPARNVTVETKFYLMSPHFPDPVGEQNAFMLDAQDSETYIPRNRMVLHHTQDETLHRHVFISKTDLERATSYEDIKFIVPVIIGSVRYEFIADNEFYYTHFMYNVFREPEGYRVGINPLDGSVPEKQLRLIRDLAGCYST